MIDLGLQRGKRASSDSGGDRTEIVSSKSDVQRSKYFDMQGGLSLVTEARNWDVSMSTVVSGATAEECITPVLESWPAETTAYGTGKCDGKGCELLYLQAETEIVWVESVLWPVSDG